MVHPLLAGGAVVGDLLGDPSGAPGTEALVTDRPDVTWNVVVAGVGVSCEL